MFDLKRQKLLFKELVSHGRGSGNAEAESFSNIPESCELPVAKAAELPKDNNDLSSVENVEHRRSLPDNQGLQDLRFLKTPVRAPFSVALWWFEVFSLARTPHFERALFRAA